MFKKIFILYITANAVNDVETFLLLNQSMVMTVLGLKLGSWLKIEQMQKSLRDGIDNTPAQVSLIPTPTEMFFLRFLFWFLIVINTGVPKKHGVSKRIINISCIKCMYL